MSDIPDLLPKSILVIKLGHIGDVLVTTPVINALKTAWPEAKITSVVNQGTEAMLAFNPQVDRVLVVRRDKCGALEKTGQTVQFLRDLRLGNYDLSLELSGGDRGAWLSLLSGSRFRVGFEPKKKHIRSRVFNLMVSQRGTENHVVETFLRQTRALGLDDGVDHLRYYPGEAAMAKAVGIMAENSLSLKGFALVHPTSRWMFKSWTAGGNARVIDHLLERGYKVALTSAPAKAELEFVAAIKAELGERPGLVDLSGALSLSVLGALIGQARIFFGVDSAPMHMAAGLGTPTVVLFGPSGDKMWGPRRVDSEVVLHPDYAHCHPCGRDGCDGTKISRCLTELDPELAVAAINRLLIGTE